MNNQKSTSQSDGQPRTFVTRREYDEWVNEAVGLATALNYPVQPSMANDGTGIVFGDDQYEAFRNGLWSREPYEVMVIFESLNEPAVDGLPAGAEPYAEYSGLCDKLMIVHPGKFCPPHFHQRKTESYEVVLGEMEVFYGADPVDFEVEGGFAARAPMPKGEPWPADVVLPAGREESYRALTSYARLRRGDPKFVMHRQHLHAFRCPPDSRVPLVVREISTYSHEPTEAAAGKVAPLPGWAGIHDNDFVSDSANTGRLGTRIVP
jgi:hypothetical protein